MRDAPSAPHRAGGGSIHDGETLLTAEMVDGVPVIKIEPGTGPGYPTRCFP